MTGNQSEDSDADVRLYEAVFYSKRIGLRFEFWDGKAVLVSQGHDDDDEIEWNRTASRAQHIEGDEYDEEGSTTWSSSRRPGDDRPKNLRGSLLYSKPAVRKLLYEDKKREKKTSPVRTDSSLLPPIRRDSTLIHSESNVSDVAVASGVSLLRVETAIPSGRRDVHLQNNENDNGDYVIAAASIVSPSAVKAQISPIPVTVEVDAVGPNRVRFFFSVFVVILLLFLAATGYRR